MNQKLLAVIVFFAISFFSLPVHAKVQVVYVNGIDNDAEDIARSEDALKNILTKNGYEHSVIVSSVPYLTDGFFTDITSLYFAKCAEEIYAPAFRRLIAGEQVRVIPKAVAKNLYFVGCGSVLGQEELNDKTLNVIREIIKRVDESDEKTILIGHSFGNLLVHYAFIFYAQERGLSKAIEKMTIINMANTSMFSPFGFDITAKNDRAIDFLKKLPKEKSIEEFFDGKPMRETPSCQGVCDFEVLLPTVQPSKINKLTSTSGIDHFLRHSFVDIYLSDKVDSGHSNKSMREKFLEVMERVLPPMFAPVVQPAEQQSTTLRQAYVVYDEAKRSMEPGTSEGVWKLGANGRIYFNRKMIAISKYPEDASLWITETDAANPYEYMAVVDSHYGVGSAFIWEKNESKIVAVVRPEKSRLLSTKVHWSPGYTHAVIPEGGEVGGDVTLVDLATGRMSNHTVAVAVPGNCQFASLDGVSWSRNLSFVEFSTSTITGTETGGPCDYEKSLVESRVTKISIPQNGSRRLPTTTAPIPAKLPDCNSLPSSENMEACIKLPNLPTSMKQEGGLLAAAAAMSAGIDEEGESGQDAQKTKPVNKRETCS